MQQITHHPSTHRPDLVSLNAALSACEKGGAWPAALGLLRRMLGSQGTGPDVVSYSSALRAVGIAGVWQLLPTALGI